MTDLSGRVAVVTGASRGIGAAVAKGLAKAGAHVILLARTQGALEAIDDEIRSAGGSATLLPIDLGRSHKDIEKLGPSIHERFGRLDILIGNAGILGTLGPSHQVEMKQWERVMQTNYFANIRLVQSLDPLLRASDAGRVVFTSSGLAHHFMAYWGAYSASKAALNAFAKIYALETEKTKMRVNLVEPGIVDTAMLAEAFPGGFQGEMRKPEDLVRLFLDLCSPSCKQHGEIVGIPM